MRRRRYLKGRAGWTGPGSGMSGPCSSDWRKNDARSIGTCALTSLNKRRPLALSCTAPWSNGGRRALDPGVTPAPHSVRRDHIPPHIWSGACLFRIRRHYKLLPVPGTYIRPTAWATEPVLFPLHAKFTSSSYEMSALALISRSPAPAKTRRKRSASSFSRPRRCLSDPRSRLTPRHAAVRIA